ncbi:hypothetical protein D3OALGA1CA_2772 [Olavius algarvensis associated proteobacterium Delta 3]|nr:hypothetical protein D3OALGB2SA_791 [Olavius algarvensis associated proteobacterium Delta 3]CAB5124052.1 hypothetical protein D3OALGA1CA_2772 [Olavius algarvensis associated proteobacterium Delta 3]
MEAMERRREERFEMEIPAIIRVSRPSANRLELVTSNVCSGGAYFHTPQPLPEGTDVRIDLVLNLEKLKTLKDDHKQVYVELKGTVIRTESEGMSICFNQDYQFRPHQET